MTPIATNGRVDAWPALDGIPAALLAIREDGVVAVANRRAADLLRASAEHVVGTPLPLLVAAPERERLEARLADPQAFTLTAVLGDGTGRVVRLEGAEPAADRSRLVALSHADRSAADPLAQGDARLARMLLSLDEGFVVVDSRPSIVEVNEAAARMLGTTREALVGQQSMLAAGFPILAEDGRVLTMEEGPVGRCLATGEPLEDMVFQTRTPRGLRWMRASVRPIKDAEGRTGHVVAHFSDVTEAKQIEGRLDVAERRFRTLIEQLPLVVYVDLPDHSGTNVYSSPRVLDLIGYTLEEWSDSRSFWEMVHPDDKDRVQRALDRQLETRGRFLEEYRLVARNGNVVWVRDESVVICDDDGTPRYVQGYYLDITSRRASEEALRLERARFAQLAENIEELFFVFDLAQRRFVYVSPAYERLSGREVAAVYADSMAYLDFVHEDDRHLLSLEAFSAAGARGTVVFRFRRADGTVGWLQSRWFPVYEDEVAVRFVGLAQDVTERKRAEAALEVERQRFAQLAAHIQGVFTIYEVDEGTYVYVSPAWEAVTGRPVEEAYADPSAFTRLVHPADAAIARQLEACRDRAEAFEAECRYLRPGGEVAWAWVRLFPIVEEGRGTRVVGFTEDVTERKHAQLALDEERLRFAQLVDNIEDVFWVYDLEQHRHVFVSQVFGRLTGITPEALQADRDAFLQCVVEDDLPIALEMVGDRERGVSGEYEFRVRRPDGTISWIWDRSFPVHRDGAVVRLAGVSEDVTDRKQAERELREQQQRFRQLADNIAGMFWVYDIALGKHVYVSPAYERLLGESKDEALADPNRILRHVHPDDIDRVRAANDLRDLGVATEEEFRYLRPDGSVGWLWRRSFPVVESDRVVRLAGLTEDVTERKLAQQELELERERFLTLADNVDGVFWILDVVEGRITYVSPAFEEVWGLPRTRIYDHREAYIEAVHPEDRAAVLELDFEQQSGVATVAEYRVVRPDGSERWVRDRAFPITEDGRVVRVAGIAEDVTERRRDDAERAELARRWRELFDDAPVMYVVCRIDDEGRLFIEDANNALLDVLERDRSEVIGRPADDFYDAVSVERYLAEGVPLAEGARDRERTLISASGRTIDVLIDAAPVLDPEGRLIAIRGTLTDITAKKATEQRLRTDADALGRLGGVAASADGLEVKLERVLRIALDRFGFLLGALLVHRPDGDPLVPVAVVGDSEPELAAATLAAAATLIAAGGSEMQVVPLAGTDDVRVVGLPLAQQTGGPGLMAFAARSDAFDAGERELLALIAQWAQYELARETAQDDLRESEEVHRALSDSLRRLGEHVEAVREDERRRIAREIHDELGQALTALKFDLHWLQGQTGPEASERLAHMIDMVEQTIDAVRRVCADLRPPMLDDLGLVAALEWHASTVERTTGIVCRVSSSGVPDRAVPTQVVTEAFRITQEALTNVARHAGATRADVRVHVAGGALELRVEDDGRGIAGGETSSGLGILGMRERALRVDGSLEVEASATGGTAIVLRVPL